MKKVSKVILLMLLIVSLVFSISCNSKKNANDNNASANTTASSDNKNSSNAGKKVLVAYFSVTNNTKNVAESIADLTNADLYAIEPEIPYTSADLNWRDENSRVMKEMSEGDFPEMKSEVPSLEDYDAVFIGYPIWGGKAPNIVSYFVLESDLSGKTVIPFCTSSSSPFGTSDATLKELSDESTIWLPGHRFSSNSSRSSIKSWLDSLSL